MRARVLDRVFARIDLPLAPWSDDLQFRSQRLGGQLKTDLVVAFPGAAVRERVGADFLRDFHLTLGEQRARE